RASRDGHRPCARPSPGCRSRNPFLQPRSSTSVAWRALATAAREPILLLEFEIGSLDDVGEDLDVAIDLLAELLAGTAAGVGRHRPELLAHPAIGERAPPLRTELVGDRGRRAGRDE